MVGLLFMEHGTAKLFGFPAPGPALHGLEIPAALIEAVGGLMVALGAYTRFAAFILSGEMALAYFLAHFPRSFFPIANGGDAAVLYCFIFFYFVFAGGGPWSVDRLALKQE